MIDLTINHDDKDKFITKVYMNDEEKKYYIQYASGRIEENEFSIHNLNVSLLNMERQYLEYRDNYVDRVMSVRAKVNWNKLIEAFIALGGIYLTTNISMPMALKIIIDGIIVVLSLYYQKMMSIKSALCNKSLNVIMTADTFLENKEQFMIKVDNPKTGEKEDWYLVTLSSIEEFIDANELNLIGKCLTDDVLDEEVENTNKLLKKIYNQGDEVSC